MTDTLDRRALNRATLARQLLLERTGLTVPAAVEHLVGMQAQAPRSWYVGLWTRLERVDPAATGALLESRELVRLPLMRSTIHLVTVGDALAIRPLVDPVIDRVTSGAFGRHLAGVDRAALVAAASGLVAERPLLASELGRGLAEHFPGRDPDALAQGARAWLPMVQVPPRAVWGRGGRALQASLAAWAGAGRDGAGITVDELVLRYLAAFGPASARDVQAWCGLTRLAEVLDRLRPRLRTFTGPDGAALFDLPGAPRPGPDVPAPVRFLYDFDNLLLSYADRSRVFGERAVDYAGHGYPADGNRQPSSLLVDGLVAGTWTVERAKPAAVLTVRGFRRLTPDEVAEVEVEGAALLAFLHPAATPEVRVVQGP